MLFAVFGAAAAELEAELDGELEGDGSAVSDGAAPQPARSTASAAAATGHRSAGHTDVGRVIAASGR
ncbi:hypothetical protein GCM10007979_06650 [Nocardioides albus]|nr:hypothetical protein GCM10007979_06650 [Nocardioides albus]